ncbi:MAG: MFS transporter, partial [Defluviitaleaceae bacterium]|nr:MFS transporter [Defluviitaleaceae bacterium]
LLVFFMSAKRKQETEKVTEAPDTISAPDPNGRKMRPVETQSGLKAFVKLLNNKIVLCVYLTSFVFGLTMTFIHNFIGIRITELGANESQIGIALFIAAFSEIPIFLTIDRVFRKHKPEYLLMLSAFFMGLRLVIMYFAQSVLLIYIAQMVHGFSFIIHLYFCIVLLHEHSPPHMKATVQTIHAMIRMGVGAILGGLGGGFLAQHIGIESVFLTLAIFVTSTCFVLPGVLICMHKARNKKDK